MSEAFDKDRQDRLRREAEFQDERTRQAEGEPRERFYWVIAGAYADFRAACRELAGRRVLVVGCAEGEVTPLARLGAQVVGIDISGEAIVRQRDAIAREGLAERAEVHVMDAEELEFEDASFDAVVCLGVLHHLDVDRACAAWQRVLKPGGEILMVEPQALNPVAALYRRLTPGMRTPDEHPLQPADLRRLRRSFQSVEVRPYGFLSLACLVFAWLPDRWGLGAGALRGLNAVDRVLFRLLPPVRHLAWTAFVRCRAPRSATAR